MPSLDKQQIAFHLQRWHISSLRMNLLETIEIGNRETSHGTLIHHAQRRQTHTSTFTAISLNPPAAAGDIVHQQPFILIL